MKLPKITHVTAIYGIEPFAGGFTEVVIANGSKEVRLRCDPKTDELLVTSGLKKKRPSAVSIISGTFQVTALWSMTNQQGYFDGFRIELRRAKKYRAFDFISAASAVEIYEAKKEPNQALQPTAAAGRG